MGVTDPIYGEIWRALRRRWLIAPILLILLIWAVWCSIRLIEAYHDIHGGQQTVQSIKGQLANGNLATVNAEQPLNGAASKFRHGYDALNSGVVAPLRIVPIVSRQLQTTRDMAKAAGTLTAAGSSTLGQVQGLLKAPHGQPAQRAALASSLSDITQHLSDIVNHVSLGPSHGLVGPVLTARRKAALDLEHLRSGMTRSTGAARSLSTLLKGNANYLVLTANNSEMRAGSGMFLGAGTLQISNGNLSFGNFTPTSQIQVNPPAPPPPDINKLWGTEQPGADYRNLALSPQFPTNAAMAAQMWQSWSHQPVNGVLVVDPVGLSDLMTAVGSVNVQGTSFNSTNVVSYLVHDQYENIGSSQQGHYDAEGGLASSVFSQLMAAQTNLSSAVKGMDQAANGRHLLVWSSDPGIQSGWQQAAVSGDVGPNDLLLSVLNEGGNKLDPFIATSANVNTKSVSSKKSNGDKKPLTEVTVSVKVKNQTPPGQNAYIAGSNGSPPASGRYVGALALDVPGGSGDPHIAGQSVVQADGPDGATTDEMAMPIDLMPGAETTVTYQFVVAGHHGSLRVNPGARINPTTWRIGSTTFNDQTAHLLEW